MNVVAYSSDLNIDRNVNKIVTQSKNRHAQQRQISIDIETLGQKSFYLLLAYGIPHVNNSTNQWNMKKFNLKIYSKKEAVSTKECVLNVTICKQRP